MINFKYYRYIRVLFGSRSFVKDGPNGKTRLLIKGQGIDNFIAGLLDEGYIEEWPLDRIQL